MTGEKETEHFGKGIEELIPGSQGFSIKHMDSSINPWEDFFTFASGTWSRNNPVPADKSHWGAFEELRELNTFALGDIMEKCSKNASSYPKSSNERMLGNFYRSAMNTKLLEKLRFEPIRKYLTEIDRIDSPEALTNFIVTLHSTGVFPFYRAYSSADKKNSTVYALYLAQGGLSLPNRDYYLSEKFEDIRGHYVKHLEKVFTLYGLSASDARRYADEVMSFETDLARSSRSQTELRDAEKNYNRFEVKDLDGRFPALHLPPYLKGMGVPKTDYVILGQPEFFGSLNARFAREPHEQFKAYLIWTVLNASAPFLFAELEDEHFDMFSRKIRGQKEPEARWKRAVHATDQFFGEALGELYVREHFGQEARARMSELVDDIREVFSERLRTLPWMTDATRRNAISKFERFRAKIGHPEKFRDYSSIEIKDDDYFGNVGRAASFEVHRQMTRVGSPVDRNEWFMTPPTINAYFSPPDNEIVFPAGILQPPFFDPGADDAVNYGAIGAVISHEITHGYDDQGRRYDKDGNLKDWWQPEDRENFTTKAREVVNAYSSLEVLPDLRVNGELTLGENIADLGGISIAYEALQRHLKKYPHLRKPIDGFTPEQRFFLAWAQMWRENTTEPQIRMLATVDTHSPNKFRAMIPVYNHPEFEKAFTGSGKGDEQDGKTNKIGVW